LVGTNGDHKLKSGYWNLILYNPVFVALKLSNLRIRKFKTSKPKNSGDLKKLPSINPVFFKAFGS